MFFEQFSLGTSTLHQLDPRVKLVSAVVTAIVFALCQEILTAVIGIFGGLVLVLWAGLDLAAVAKRLLVVNGFIVFLWFTLPLTYPGEAAFFWGPIEISLAGIRLAALLTCKANALVLIFIALLATSSITELGLGLERLGCPAKLRLLLLFSYRYIFVIFGEYQRLARAAKLRSFTFGTNLHTYRTVGYLFGMTLVKSWHRADRVREAMLLRGFNGHFHSLQELRLNPRDLIFLFVLLPILASLFLFEML